MLTSKFFGILSFACFGTIVLTAVPSYAAVIDFSSWESFGDVVTPIPGATSMSNDGLLNDDAPSDNGTYSYTNKIYAVDAQNRNPTGTLQTNLGFSNSALDAVGDAYEGSGIKYTYNATAKDQLTFNWQFLTNETDVRNKDFGFFSVDTTVYQLANMTNATNASTQFNKETGIGSYTYTFEASGDYNLAFGVVDMNNYNATSALQITNANFQAVPEPISIVSSIMALGCGASLRRRFGKKAIKC
jgi:hypothetical protein